MASRFFTGVGDGANRTDYNVKWPRIAYWSSNLDGSVLEKIVPSHHSSHQHPEGIAEVLRILKRHGPAHVLNSRKSVSTHTSGPVSPHAGVSGERGCGDESAAAWHILAKLQVPPFKLQLHGMSMFRTRQKAVIWAVVKDAHDGLKALYGEVLRALNAAHIEMNPFIPSTHHACEAQGCICPQVPIISGGKPILRVRDGCNAIEGFTLFSSVLGPVGAAYSMEER